MADKWTSVGPDSCMKKVHKTLQVLTLDQEASISLSMEIIFEDDDLIAVNKPPGLPSQATVDTRRPHVISQLQIMFPQGKFFLHHRLDRDTSGVLLLGKSERINKAMTEIFREHQIQKTYQALSKRSEIQIGGEWTVENHLAPVRSGARQLMRMVVVKKGGWIAKTQFRLLHEFSDFLHIEAQPITGRTHQIRVHLASDKRPILGDNLYGGKSNLVPRLMLHAGNLKLKHPITGKILDLCAPVPKDFATLLRKANEAANPSNL